MKVALYMRVSTTDQHCEVQARELHEYCQRRGWDVATGHEYIDQGVSARKAGKASPMPALDKLMTAAAQRRFDAIVVWKLDRFARSVSHFNKQIDTLKAAGVRFIAVSQNIDTDQSSPTGQLLMQILAAMAEFERELIRERTASGVAAARAAGKTLGRPAKVFRRDEALRMRQEGMSYRAIAKALNVATTTIVETVKGERSARATRKGVRKSPSPPLDVSSANTV